MKSVKIEHLDIEIEIPDHHSEEYFKNMFVGQIKNGNEFAKVNNAIKIAENLGLTDLALTLEAQKIYFYSLSKIHKGKTLKHYNHPDYLNARRELMRKIREEQFSSSAICLIDLLL